MKAKFLLFIGLILLCGFIFIQAANAQIIPPDRRIDWSQVGVSGGIPNRTTICTTIDAATYGNGATDTTTVIQNAINNCPAGQVVKLTAGTFRLDHGLSMKSNITLRGSGPTSILEFRAGNGYVMGYINVMGFGGSDTPSYIANWTSGYTKGGTILTLDSTTGLSPGMTLYLKQLDDESTLVFATGYDGIQGSPSSHLWQNHMGQAVKVVSIVGSVVTIDPPLYYTYSSGLSPKAFWAVSNIEYAGLEDFKLVPHDNGDGTYGDNSATTNNIFFYYAQNCWATGLDIIRPWRSFISMIATRNLEFRENYFHTPQGIASQSYGFGVQFTSASLFEDNIWVGFPGGWVSGPFAVSGNVIAYNYMPLIEYVNPYYLMAGAIAHGSHTYMNLFEGNYVATFSLENGWGSSSHNTAFRNYFWGWQSGKTQQTTPITIAAHSRYNNIVGNVLGTSGFHNTYQLRATVDGVCPYNSPTPAYTSIYILEYWANCQLGSQLSQADYQAYTTLLRHANYDVVTAGVKYCDTDGGPGCQGGDASHTLPVSLYLTSKPSWFGSVPWPPAGPDVAGLTNKIPAQLRYEAMTGGDTTPPSVPANLTATAVSSSQINLAWTASTDNVGVTGYRVYRGGTQIGTATTNSYSDTGLSPSTTYSYTVAAYDAAGNVSGQSASASATTPAGTTKRGDFNNDSKVDVIDLGIFLSSWGSTAKPAADINQDGKVDVIDLGILLSSWG